MPLQNRVTPFGLLVAVPERGTLMGNRGILHDAGGRLRRRWAGRAWIACLLQFRGRRGPVMAPGHYTRLFFLDEPTTLAAGHRPCAECRHADFVRFREAWAAGNVHLGLGSRPRAAEIDRVLHAERVGPGGRKRTHPADLATLPDGAVVTFDAAHSASAMLPDTRGAGPADPDACLVWQRRLWQWTPGGYRATDRPLDGPAALLTPPSIVAALEAGYAPMPPAVP
ncbi:MAG: hypothetical protein IT306_10785 [Chloroflexi bacterium]|nr:hypothetical protein [Chloroflexota bacterium]